MAAAGLASAQKACSGAVAESSRRLTAAAPAVLFAPKVEPLLQLPHLHLGQPGPTVTRTLQFSSTKRALRQRRAVSAAGARSSGSRAYRTRASAFCSAQEHVLSDSVLGEGPAGPVVVHNLRDRRERGSPAMTWAGDKQRHAVATTSHGSTWLLSLALHSSML